MSEEVVTTPRSRLTSLQLLRLWEQANGCCCICGEKIDPDKGWIDTLKGSKGFIDEHKRALVLGGSNKLSNRGPAHIWCAEVKTKDDMARGAKAKQQKARRIGAARPKKQIKSRGFNHTERAHEDRQSLKPKGLFK